MLGAGCCCGWMGASIRGWMGAVASWPARRPVPPLLSFVSLKPEQVAAAVAGVLTSATHPVACSQGGRAHSSADLLRRLKTRFVEGLDVEEEDPFAFDWCGFQLLRCSRCMLGCGCGCLGEAVRRAEQMQGRACSRIDPHVLRRSFPRRLPAAAEPPACRACPRSFAGPSWARGAAWRCCSAPCPPRTTCWGRWTRSLASAEPSSGRPSARRPWVSDSGDARGAEVLVVLLLRRPACPEELACLKAPSTRHRWFQAVQSHTPRHARHCFALCAGPAARPEELTSLEDGEKQETDRNMEAMWHLLKDVGGRCDSFVSQGGIRLARVDVGQAGLRVAVRRR